MRQASIVLVLFLLLCSIAACASPTPTQVPAIATVPASPKTDTPVPATLVPSQSTPQPTSASSTGLEKETVEFLAPLSSDETEIVVQGIENLNGVKDVQTNNQKFQISFDPAQVSAQQIVSVMKSFGFPLKQ